MVGPAIAAAIAFALLVGLGAWQLQRLAWKEAILARIDSRIHQPPAPLPPRAQWATLDPDDYDYAHVRVRGRYLQGQEALIFRSSAPLRADADDRAGM